MMYSQHRKKLFDLFEENKDCILFFSGGTVARRYDTDFEYPFRQESNFLYLTGVDEPDMAAMMDCKTGEYTLIIPRRDTQYAVWMGYLYSPDEYQKKYGPDRVIYADELDKKLKLRKPEVIHCLPAAAGSIKEMGFRVETGELGDAMAYCRSIKSEDEIRCLKKAASVANQAHRDVMKAVSPDTYEYELKALFQYRSARNGMMHLPYSGIFASGPGSAILHYVEYHRKLHDGELFLLDAGAEYRGYAADITRTMPVNGKFNTLQAELYDIVLESQEKTIEMARPGNKMEDLHLTAARIIVSGLRDCGLVKGSIDELMDKNVFALFFPHGLGHFLGLDTHDVGGYPKGTKRIDRPGLRFLRARRTFEPGMVITIEPGLYIIPALLEPSFSDPGLKVHLDVSRLSQMMEFGGIRIEDNIIIRENGPENLTDVPKTRSDIEQFMTSEPV